MKRHCPECESARVKPIALHSGILRCQECGWEWSVGSTTDTELLIYFGKAMWGPRWQAEMARALGVHPDTVQDWRQGRMIPRPGVWTDLRKIGEQRRSTLAEILAAIDKLQERTKRHDNQEQDT
jgi:hypothetical protein